MPYGLYLFVRLCENATYVCRGQVANINTKISVFVDSSNTRDGLK